MAKRDKRIEAMRRNPKNVRLDDLHIVLVSEGFSWRQPGTSHRVYTRGKDRFSIPQRQPFLKPEYVLLASSYVDTGQGQNVAEETTDGGNGKDGGANG